MTFAGVVFKMNLISFQKKYKEPFYEHYQILSVGYEHEKLNYLIKKRVWIWNKDEERAYHNLLDIMPLLVYIHIKEISFRKLAQWFPMYDVLSLLSFTHFPSLCSLDLSQNMIQSLQMLQRLKAPCLQQLNLQKNRIMCVKVLRKCDLSHLKELNLQCNPIVNLEPLAELNFQNMKKLSIINEEMTEIESWQNLVKNNRLRKRVNELKEVLYKSNYYIE